jgi:hypothetical protein
MILARQKGDKDYTDREKQMMISLINDCSLFGALDDEMIRMLSLKLGKDNSEKISETLFYRLKKEAKAKRGESEQWLDYYARYRFVEFYRKRIKELELVQRKLLKTFIDEIDKQAEKQDKTIINQLSKTIAENSKVLGEFGMIPHVIHKVVKSVTGKYLSKKNKVNEDYERIKRFTAEISECAFYLKLNYEDPPIQCEDPQRVF